MIRRLLHEETGQTIAEYSLILGFVILVAAAIIVNLQEPILALYADLNF